MRPYAGETEAHPDPPPEIIEQKRLDRLRAVAPALIGHLVTGQPLGVTRRFVQNRTLARFAGRHSASARSTTTERGPQAARAATWIASAWYRPGPS
jgi:hypothetical protein